MNDNDLYKGPTRRLGTMSHLNYFYSLMRGQCCDLEGIDGAWELMLEDWEPLHFTKYVRSVDCLNDRVEVCGLLSEGGPYTG